MIIGFSDRDKKNSELENFRLKVKIIDITDRDSSTDRYSPSKGYGTRCIVGIASANTGYGTSEEEVKRKTEEDLIRAAYDFGLKNRVEVVAIARKDTTLDCDRAQIAGMQYGEVIYKSKVPVQGLELTTRSSKNYANSMRLKGYDTQTIEAEDSSSTTTGGDTGLLMKDTQDRLIDAARYFEERNKVKVIAITNIIPTLECTNSTNTRLVLKGEIMYEPRKVPLDRGSKK